jgi:uncharacterized protein YdaU (DUF1376 family)
VNYYERHIGDYLKDTAHLSLLEHGVYGRLLDVYYTRECGIDDGMAARLIGARSKEERGALEVVLNEFFTLEGGIWTHGRCDREIEKFQQRADHNRRVGKLGGRPRKSGSKEEPTENPPGYLRVTEQNPHETLPTHQTPDTSNQKPEEIHTPTPTEAGRVCRLLKLQGVADVNPGHPDLRILLEAGATDAEFIGAAVSATAKGKGFAYALGTLKRQRQEAAATVGTLHKGGLPNKQQAIEQRNRAVAAEWLKGSA